GVGLRYLVVHMHKNGGIERGSGQARVVRFAEREFDVCQFEAPNSPGKLDEVIPRHILGNHRAGGADELGEPGGVVAAAWIVVPGFSSRRRAISPASFRASRCSSSERLGLTISATGRLGEGNSFAGIPGGAR